jgi:hypothetical protein
VLQHREENYPRKDVKLPKFGERFSGPNAPLSWAVAQAGIEIQESHDKERDSRMDVFIDTGKEYLLNSWRRSVGPQSATALATAHSSWLVILGSLGHSRCGIGTT